MYRKVQGGFLRGSPRVSDSGLKPVVDPEFSRVVSFKSFTVEASGRGRRLLRLDHERGLVDQTKVPFVKCPDSSSVWPVDLPPRTKPSFARPQVERHYGGLTDQLFLVQGSQFGVKYKDILSLFRDFLKMERIV